MAEVVRFRSSRAFAVAESIVIIAGATYAKVKGSREVVYE